MRTHCATCGAVLTPGHDRHCDEACRQKELEYQREYHQTHKPTAEQRRKKAEYCRKRRAERKAKGITTPKVIRQKVTYQEENPEPLPCGTGYAISEPGSYWE